MKGKINERLDWNLEPFEKGLYFASKSGDFTDLTNITVLNISVDTIRQMYKGTIPFGVIYALKALTENGSFVAEKQLVEDNTITPFHDFKIPFDCHITRMGKNSGFRFKLQNNEKGIVILLGSYYKEDHKEGTHLKIELSPKLLASNTPVEAQKIMDDIASLFLVDIEPIAIAPHLCVDVQNWDIPLHMQDDIVTRSRYIRSYTGVDNVEFDNFDNVISTFGRAETLMVGRTTSLQLSVYRKDLEIVKKDSVDYWHDVWSDYSLGSFDKTKPVTRIEYRFHHSVIQDFERGIGEDIKTYVELSQYLNNLWQYALETIRHEKNSYVSPIWQFLYEDISFNSNDIRKDFKREQRAKSDTTAIGRNIGMFIGNFLSIKARIGVAFNVVQFELQNMSVMHEIRSYIIESGIDEGTFFESLKQKYLERLTVSRYAA